MVRSETPPMPIREPLLGLDEPVLAFVQIASVLKERMPPNWCGIVEQQEQAIEEEVIAPLLSARNYEELREIFSAVSPQYIRREMLVGLLIWSTLKESLVGWLPETLRNWQMLIEEVGPKIVGQHATNDCLLGLSAFRYVMRGVTRRMPPQLESLPVEHSMELFWWLEAFKVALLPVIELLANQKEVSNQVANNARILASWAHYYGVGAYEQAKLTGLLKVPDLQGEQPYTTPEMLREADAVIADGLRLASDDATETW